MATVCKLYTIVHISNDIPSPCLNNFVSSKLLNDFFTLIFCNSPYKYLSITFSTCKYYQSLRGNFIQLRLNRLRALSVFKIYFNYYFSYSLKYGIIFITVAVQCTSSCTRYKHNSYHSAKQFN